MFKKYKEAKRLKEEQEKLVEFFLKDHSIKRKLAKSVLTEHPYEIELFGNPSEEIKKAISDLGYGEISDVGYKPLLFKANPKKFDNETYKNYVEAYKYIKKDLRETIIMKKKSGNGTYIFKYIDAPYFDLDCFWAIEEKLKSDFPSFEFNIHIAPAFANDSLEVSGYAR